MADITKFDLMKIIGMQMAAYIMESGNAFTKDLMDKNGNDLLVKATGDIIRIKTQMSDPFWLDNFKT